VSARPGWIVGLVAFAALVYITVNTLRTTGPGSTGIAAGHQLPPFAAPLVTSDLVGDANVATRAGQAQAGPRPACEVRDPRALNVCTLARRGPVVLTFFTAGAKDCIHALDALDLAARRHRDVGFAAVAIRGDRRELRKLVRAHGWTFPVAQDRDGAVANLYGVAVCPTVVFAFRGGRVQQTAIGERAASGAGLEERVRRLERGPIAHAT
jgi:AhpC/TSA family